MILTTGETLFDHFPEYRRVGGAALNFSWHLKKLGFEVRLVTRVGNDPEGRELKNLLERGGFDASDLQSDNDHPTGSVNVSVDSGGVPTFEILAGAAFDYLKMDDHVRSLLKQEPELIYFGTLTQRTETGRRFAEKMFSQASGTTRFLCDLNLRPGCFSPETVEASLAGADILKLNEEELTAVVDITGMKVSDSDPCRALMERYNLEMVAVTRGDKGSDIHVRERSYSIGAAQDPAVADTVGAGDAYASILAAGYLEGWHPEKILSVASRFSAAICELEGALPDSDLFYKRFVEVKGA